MSEATVVNNEELQRLELRVDGHLAELVYELEGDRMVLIHTEVPEVLGGRGIGGRLVSAAVDIAASHGQTVVPICPYARRWLRTHPDTAGRVPIDWG